MSQYETEQEELARLRKSEDAYKDEYIDATKYNIDLLAFNWEELMRHAVVSMLKDVGLVGPLANDHIEYTPQRVVKAYKEYFRGASVDTKKLLSTSFVLDDSDNGMVIIKDVTINSLCMHHLVPFIGIAHFGYVPNGKVVGLSKIPRVIDAWSGRPQIQEKLGRDIVNEFQEVVEPFGCGIVIEAKHLCMNIRGVKAHAASTRTVRLAGVFLEDASVKQEFLDGIK